jgi:oligopeptide/dipeptide ABC transporter ATP-binding protein
MAGSGTAHLRPAEDTLLRAENLTVDFPVGRSGLAVHAVSDVSIDVREGETLGLVGESGCGKSTTGRAMMQLPRPNGGSVRFGDLELSDLSGPELRRVRPEMQMIFQDPISSLNPRRRVRDIVAEPLRIWASENHPPSAVVRLLYLTVLADAFLAIGFAALYFLFLLVNSAIPGLIGGSIDVLPSVDQWLRDSGTFIVLYAIVFGVASLILAPQLRDRVSASRGFADRTTPGLRSWLRTVVEMLLSSSRVRLVIETVVAGVVLVAVGTSALDAATVIGGLSFVLLLLACVLLLPSLGDFREMGRVRAEHLQIVRQTLENVGIDPDSAMDRRPHQFSGGQCQRICIARALVLEPKLVICDEPVSALDVSVQAQILNLLEDMKSRYGLTLVFIAHDLAVVKNVSDRVAVMYLGKLCEVAPPDTLYAHPAHPYTAALLGSIPVPDPAVAVDRASTLSGELPSPVNPPSGCRFRTRCPRAQDMCAQVEPKMRKIDLGHFVACHYPLEVSSDSAARGTRS